MANQAVGFGALLTGGVLLTAAITGSSVPDVMRGKASGATNLGGAGDAASGGSTDAASGGMSGGYANPFGGGHPVIGRTDMGVDVSLKPGDPIRAIGDARIVGITQNWYSGQPYLWYQLMNGPHAGKHVFVAEQFVPSVSPGDTVKAGDPIGHYAAHGTGIEIGWAGASGQTLAQETTGYTEGQVTPAGSSFRGFLRGFGL